MPVQQNLDLLTRLAYLQAGGRDPGQRDIDKLNQTFQAIGNTGKTIMDYVTTDAALKKAELERQKLQQENTPLVNIVGGQTPVQTQANVNQVMKQPIPAQDLISGRLDTTQQGLENIGRSVKQGQDIYDKYGTANAEQAQKIAATRYYEPKTALTEAQTKKALQGKEIKQFNASDLTNAAQRIYMQVPGRTIDDSMSKEEFLENEKYARALISGGVGQKEENIILSKIMDELPKLESAALSSKNAYSSINQALGLIKEGVTGKAGQAKAILAQYQDFFPGEDIKNLDDAQTFQLLTRAIVGPMRLDIVGPGPVSEYEQKLMQQISGGGGASRGAADALLNYYKKLAVNKVNAYNSRLSGASKLNESISGLFNKVELEDKKEPAFQSGFVKVIDESGVVGEIPAKNVSAYLKKYPKAKVQR
jgi:hypothetical protein